MQYKVYIRADGNSRIGLGHLVRCLALACMLKDDFNVHFICKEAPEQVKNQIQTAGFSLTQITAETEFFEILSGNEIVVLDHYSLDEQYQLKVKAKGSRLVCIDDLHDKHFYAGLIINHAPGVKSSDYSAQPYTRFALGLGFALLRPAFLEAAKTPVPEVNSDIVLICFGGADPENFTCQALAAVTSFDRFKRIIVITGAAYQQKETLEIMVNEDARITTYSDINEQEMCVLMKNSGLAIIPSSSVLLEAIACGINCITCYYADNQKDFHDNIVALGISTVGFADNLFADKLKNALSRPLTVAPVAAIRKQLSNIKENHIFNFISL